MRAHLGGSADGVGAHVLPPEPIADREDIDGELGGLLDDVDRVASRS